MVQKSKKSNAASQPIEKPEPMSATERKRKQRLRDKERGQVEVTVKVPAARVAEILDIAANWRKRKRRSDAGTARVGVSQ